MASILEDLMFNWEKVEAFYTYNPKDLSSWFARSKVLDEFPRENLIKVLPEIRSYNEKLGCGYQTLENIDALSESGTFAVVTGQQSGLFTGPLYTVYKAITTIQLAKRYSEVLGKVVVPIFWVASEDHDWFEVNHTHVLGEGKGKTFKVKGNPNKKPVGYYYLGEEASKVLDELADTLEMNNHKEDILQILKSNSLEDKTLSHWFAEVLMKLFKNEGLIIIDPLLKDFREVQGRILLEGLPRVQEIKASLNLSTQRLKDGGYAPLINQDENQLPLFMLFEEKRLPLLYEEGIYKIKGTNLGWDIKGLLAFAQENLTSLSPNVALRPIVQDNVFPTLAYVGGPGEQSYFAQLKELYSYWNLEMPIIYPRTSYLLVEPKVRELLGSLGITHEDLRESPEELADRLLENTLAWKPKELFSELVSKVEQEYRSVGNTILHDLPSLELLFQENLGRVLRQIEYLEKKTKQGLRRQNKDLIKELKFGRDRLYPQGFSQERYWNIFGFLSLYGDGWLKSLINEPLPEIYETQVVDLIDEIKVGS